MIVFPRLAPQKREPEREGFYIPPGYKVREGREGNPPSLNRKRKKEKSVPSITMLEFEGGREGGTFFFILF